MPEWLSRTELLLGKERLEKLQQAHVLVAGLGGVGAYAAEQLCRAGIGEMTIIDGDVVELTNKNIFGKSLHELVNEGNCRLWIVIWEKPRRRLWPGGSGISIRRLNCM